MIDAGAEAPGFELPAVVEGEVESVALEEFIGSDVVVLAFYPADFNPACDGTATDLDDLDLFTMQKDVSVLAVSADSVYSHRAFADEFDLHIPLLADTRGSVAADYGVAVEDPTAGYRNRRAVFVIGPGGDVEYAWSTDDLAELPPVDAVREAVDDVGGTETARARYRMGHAHYVEGRRAFTSAMKRFQNEEWMVAQSDFKRAFEEFDEATDQFNSAIRFGDDEHDLGYYEIAEDKAELLWQAAEWLAKSANAYASGEGAEGQSLRGDAERTLEDARELFEPAEPAEFPPDEPVEERLDEAAVEEIASILPDDEEDIDTSLDMDIEETPAHADEEVRAEVDEQSVPTDDAPTADGEGAAGDEGEEGDDEPEEIDEAELDEITAELEQQTEDAKREREAEEAEADDGDDEPDGNAGDAERADSTGDEEAEDAEETEGSEPGGGEPDDVSEDGAEPSAQDGEESDEEDLELELTDPTEGRGLEPLESEDYEGEDYEGEDDESEDDESEADEDDEADEEDATEDLGEDDHGVPDSL